MAEVNSAKSRGKNRHKTFAEQDNDNAPGKNMALNQRFCPGTERSHQES